MVPEISEEKLAWDRKGSPWCDIRPEETFIEGEKKKHLFVRGEVKNPFPTEAEQPKAREKQKMRKENVEDN